MEGEVSRKITVVKRVALTKKEIDILLDFIKKNIIFENMQYTSVLDSVIGKLEE